MPLSPGTQIGSCEILELIGAGGMGEVYRGRDTKLGRDVAVKAMPSQFSHDADRLVRFEREAQVLAALNHPNLAIIHELKESGGARYLILELVEGETLAERIARGPVPLEEALGIAAQISEALEAAHDKGIIHRDLKPANVKITPEGRVKVLDFGLAKIFESAAPQNLSNSPTMSAAQTAQGLILGTAAYMSPEQARGQEVDRRADVWAFGCVFYEMLTGRQVFPNGETVSDTLAGILARDPSWQALPPGTPSRLRTLLERCLRKDERRRWGGMSGVRLELEEARNELKTAKTPSPAGLSRRERIFAILAAVFLTVTAVVTFRFVTAAPASAPALRSEFWAPPGTIAGSIGQTELSPDGRTLAFQASAENKRLIWVRPLDATAPQALPSTEGTGPGMFWSADSQYIAFFAENKVKKVAAGGGPSQVVASLPEGGVFSGTWNADDVILAGNPQSGPLLRIAAVSGETTPATQLDASRKETAHAYPSFLPDNRHFLFLAQSSDPQNRATAYVGELGSKDRKPIPGIASQVRYSNGHLVFIRDGALMAQPFDVKALQTSGGAFPMADPFVASSAIAGPFSVSANGGLAYSRPLSLSTIFSTPNSELGWFDRTGKELGSAGPSGSYAAAMVASLTSGLLADLRFSGAPELSPDGNFVAFSRDTPPDIWVLNIATGRNSRLTSHAAADAYPVWSPDSRRVVFRSERDGPGNLYVRDVADVAEEKPLLADAASKFPSDWSADGNYVVYNTAEGDIWALPLTAGAGASSTEPSAAPKPRQLTQTRFFESDAKISPDGRWIAYVSNEQGGPEVYVQSFPDPGFKQPVSRDGGSMPRWSPNGRELFYAVAGTGTLMVVPITPLGNSIQAGAPQTLFPLRGPMLTISKAGRFLSFSTLGNVGGRGANATPDHMVVIHNFAAARRGGTK
jgi:Tol biopolymer transport system component